MRHKSLIISMLLLAVVAGGFIYLFNSSDASEETTKMQEVQNSSEVESPEQQPAATSTPGTYVAYSEEAVESAQGTKLLFFHAPWCPQCRDLDKNITSKGVPEGVTIYKVDYDTNQALRKKYGVTLQTTVVRIDEQGNLVKKFVAYDSPTLQAVKDALL